MANSVDPDQTPQKAASDQGLHCLPLIQQFKTHQQVVKWICLIIKENMARCPNIWGKYGITYTASAGNEVPDQTARIQKN